MLNKAILMGRLVADPELKQTASNIAVCKFTIAINRPFVSKDGGERQSDFINIVVWRNTAEFVSKYFTKGKMIIVEGADNVSFGGDKKDDTAQKQDNKTNTDVPDFDFSEFEELDGDVPF